MSATSAPNPLPETGAIPPPTGVTANFNNPYSIGGIIKAVGVLYLVLTSLTTAIRLYTKFYIIKAHGWEDYTMFMAWAGFVVCSGLYLSDIHYGAGVHEWDITFTDLISSSKRAYAIEILLSPLLAVTKLSICLQYIRIFIVHHGTKFYCIQVFIWINMLWFAAGFFVTILQCVPLAKYLEPKLHGHCIYYQSYILASGIFNLVSDILMLLFPLHCIWNLQMSTKRKLGVAAIFFVGGLAVTASIMRVIVSAINLYSRDATYQLARVAVSANGEVAAGITLGNFVVFPRFFGTYVPKVKRLFSSFHSSRSSKPRKMNPTTTVVLEPKLGMHKPKSSTPYPNKQSTSTIPHDSLELNNRGYTAAAFPPHAGSGNRPMLSTTASGPKSEPDQGGFLGLANGTEADNRIWKTVHVDQGVLYA